MSPTSEIRSPQTRSIDAVIFDFGGVLSRDGSPSDFVSRWTGADADTISRIFLGDKGTDNEHPYHRLERGEITMREFQEYLKGAITSHGLRPVEAGPNDALRSDQGSDGKLSMDFAPNQPVIELAHDLRASGLKIGVLTNNIRELRDSWRKLLDFDALFDDVVDSSEVGMRKPNPVIYRYCVERLGTRADRTAFLDDIQHNIDGAHSVGIHAFLVESDPWPAVNAVRHLAGLSL